LFPQSGGPNCAAKQMYQSQEYYDLIYTISGRNYQEEVEFVSNWIRKSQKCSTRASIQWLDIATGTGKHLKHLPKDVIGHGFDIDPAFIQLAKVNNPDLVNQLHVADMTNFNLNKKFDVISCFFSSLPYTATLENLDKMLACVQQHLTDRGCFVFEAWYSPENFKDNHFTSVFAETADLKLCRMNHHSKHSPTTSQTKSVVTIASSSGIQVIEETHVMGLWSKETYLQSLKRFFSHVVFNPTGGRGWYLCTNQSI
jgi:predicted TPR repeat methyltransferase